MTSSMQDGGQRSVPLDNPKVELRLQPVAREDSGLPTGVDVRVYRLTGWGWTITAAGFRIPVAHLRAVASALLSLADALEAIPAHPETPR